MARTSWGDPDLQGVWDYRTITPLERRPELGDREFYTDEEIAELEGRAGRRMDKPPDESTPANLVHAEYLTDPGRFVAESKRTSLIVDPPNGRIPALTAEAEQRQAQAQAAAPTRTGGRADSYLDRTLMERCITRGVAGALLPGLYNNNIRITQAPGSVAIVHEMIHETRVVPLDDGAFSDARGYYGESRGHWEGDTLVVETRNFNGKVAFRGSRENLRLTERYTRVGPDAIDFRLTIRGRNAVDAAVDGRVHDAPRRRRALRIRMPRGQLRVAQHPRERARRGKSRVAEELEEIKGEASNAASGTFSRRSPARCFSAS